MNFSFASWESPIELSESLKTEFLCAQTERYALQIAPWNNAHEWLFFRAFDASDEASFVVTRLAEPPFVSAPLGVQNFKNDTPFSLRMTLTSVLDKAKFARAFFLGAEETPRGYGEKSSLVLLVGATGWGQWIRWDTANERQGSAAFVWNSSPDAATFLRTPAREVWENIAAQKRDETSDCAFARRFLDWSNDEIRAQLWDWSECSQTPLEEVLKLFIINEIGNKYPSAWRWSVDYSGFRVHHTRTQFLQHQVSDPKNMPEEFQIALRRIQPFFEPSLRHELVDSHLAAAQWRARHRNEIHIDFFTSLTAHERLEAHAAWRDWQIAHPPRISETSSSP